MLLVALAGLELAFNLLAIEAAAPLLTAGSTVENQLRGDLITVAVLAGRQEVKVLVNRDCREAAIIDNISPMWSTD